MIKNTINFVVEAKSVSGKVFGQDNLNPGVGGTQYLTIVLANELAKTYTSLDIKLYTYYEFSIEEKAQNLELILVDPDIWTPVSKLNEVWILTISNLNGLSAQTVAELKDNFIVWSHHPSDWRVLRYAGSAKGVISTGSYQYFSNFKYSRNCGLIENLLYAKNVNPKRQNKEFFNVMFLGALVPAKGFHDLLQCWGRIQMAIPNARLHVIGGSSLYGNEISSDLPCDESYGKQLKLIAQQNQIDLSQIYFYGSLGQERFEIYRNMDVAVVNPLGKSESYSFNLHECLAANLPTLASLDYGMNDLMKNLGALAVSSRHDIERIILEIYNNKIDTKMINKNAQELLNERIGKSDIILEKWLDVLMHDIYQKPDFLFTWIYLKAITRSIIGRLKYIFAKFI